MERVECVVIGAGVVGLAVAARLAALGRETLVLERHRWIGHETSSRNSEVIHAGIYYPTDSLKARLCVRGKALLYAHCEAYQVPHRRCGKLIVATRPEQIEPVRAYIDKARANGVDDLTWLDADAVHALEPEVQAVGAVLSPSTGIVDSHALMISLQGAFERDGGLVALETPVVNLRRDRAEVIVETPDMALRAEWVVNSAGLEAPGLAAHLGPAPRACYAKGHYYAYSGRQPFSRLVYPMAEAGGLGVHVTVDLAGQIRFGPDVCWIDRVDYAFDESRFDDFVAAIRAYYPGLDPDRLHPSYTGIRPKLRNDAAFEDFRIAGPDSHGVPGCVHLFGIESPGLTASLAIAEEVAGIVGGGR